MVSPSIQQIPNKQTTIMVLTFVLYSVSPTCFDTGGSSSGSFRVISLIIELCSDMDHISSNITTYLIVLLGHVVE